MSVNHFTVLAQKQGIIITCVKTNNIIYLLLNGMDDEDEIELWHGIK